MMVRLLPIRVGARVRTRSENPYLLPDGLRADLEVTVVSYDPATYCHVVREENGREWKINASQMLDAGSEYKVDRRGLPEDHPEVQAIPSGTAPVPDAYQ